MSEADNTWRLDIDGREVEIEVEYSTMSGRIVVTVDRIPTASQRLMFTRRRIPLQLGEHVGEVSVSLAHLGFGARSALHVDGRYVEPLRR